MACWNTRWRNIDGRNIPIKPDCSKEVSIVGAVLVIAALSAGSVVGAAATGSGAAAESVTAQSIQVRVTNSRTAARRGQYSEAWRRMGLRAVTRAVTGEARREVQREVRRELECAAHSSGQVQGFLRRSPCSSLDRALTVICDAHGNTIAVSISWVRMPSPGAAVRLIQLAGTHGTVTPITSQEPELRGARFTGKHYAARRTGSTVVIAEATTVSGSPGAAMLNAVAEVAAEFPGP